jgi:uncharacterized protein
MTMSSTATHERLISADDHVDVGHDTVKTHLATKYHGAYDAGLMAFAASMGNMRSVEANSQWREQQSLGEPDGPIGMDVRRQHAASGRAGHTDAQARLADMDVDGVEASVSYCEVSAFRYLYLIEDGWKESTRAFNLALADFAAADPKRLIVNYQIPIHDIEAAVDEVRWAASAGCKSLQLPVYWDTRYDPLWTAISDADLPICLHIGLNTALDDLARRDPTPQKGIFVPLVALSAAEPLGMWIMGGVFERFPNLRVVFVEPGLGWVAWWLYIVDDLAARQGYEFPAITHAPSHYFHRNVFLTFIDEPHAIRMANETLGIENIMWSSDYPHPVSSWPNSRAMVEEMFGDADPADRELVVCGNAARVWNL